MSISDPHAIIVAGEERTPPPGLEVTNHLDPDVLGFGGQDRVGRPVNELIIHESVTRTAVSTVAVLQRRKLGVHLIVAPSGRVTQHGDLAHQRLAHAGGHNGPSVGVEVVNPYYPYLLRDDLPWRRTIDNAPWAHKDAYVLPTPEQAEATAKLIGWLASPKAVGLDIPRAWLGVVDGRVRMGRIEGGDQRRPGIYAHHYFGHADGAWLVLYAWLRLEVGLPPCVAYEEAVTRATGARSTIDVSDLTRSEPNA